MLAVVVRRRAPRLPNGLYSSQAVADEAMHASSGGIGMRAASGIIPCVPRSECALALAACSSAESLLTSLLNDEAVVDEGNGILETAWLVKINDNYL